MRIGRTRTHEAQGALIDVVGDVDLESSRDLAAEAVFGHLGRCLDPGFSGLECGKHFFGIVSDRRYDPETCDNNAAHGHLSF